MTAADRHSCTSDISSHNANPVGDVRRLDVGGLRALVDSAGSDNAAAVRSRVRDRVQTWRANREVHHRPHPDGEPSADAPQHVVCVSSTRCERLESCAWRDARVSLPAAQRTRFHSQRPRYTPRNCGVCIGGVPASRRRDPFAGSRRGVLASGSSAGLPPVVALENRLRDLIADGVRVDGDEPLIVA